MPNIWISSGVFGDPTPEIILTEVHGSHVESHNILSGNPTYKVRLACKWADYTRAISELLGKPQKWPHPTVFNNTYDVSSVRAASVDLISDQGDATPDLLNQKLDYKHFALFDVTYLPRKGRYLQLGYVDNKIDVYFEDEVQQRYESLPMDHTKLTWSRADGSPPPPDTLLPLMANEAPVRFDTGETVVRTIEGWTLPVSPTALVGTVNATEHISPILNFTFPPGTLKLRSINKIMTFSFRSYRMPNPAFPGDPNDASGKPTLTLKLQYEYKKDGWQKFWRLDLGDETNINGYYAKILRNNDLQAVVTPFLATDHSAYWDPV